MRAVGCIWNDLNDKNYDILVNVQKKINSIRKGF